MDAQAMTDFPLPGYDLVLSVLRSGAWLCVGTLIGALHFLTLRWNVRILAVDQSLALAAVMQLVRLAIMAGGLAIIAIEFGALPLVVASAGVLVARTAVLRSGGQP
jgi:F1F0 ATPase subunit 2